MAKRYSPEVAEAIWALACEGLPTREIQRRLNEGEAGVTLEAPMPRRTLNDKLASLKRARGLPVAAVKPGDEVDASRAILRSALDTFGREVRRLDDASKTRALTPGELTALDRAAKAVLDVERRLTAPPRPAPADPPKGTGPPPSDGQFLQRLAARRAAEGTSDAT
jgi:hypothetical protein